MDWTTQQLIPSKLFAYDPNFDLAGFLQGRNSFLASYAYSSPDGSFHTTFPEHLDTLCKIFDVAQKWMLISLQREQSLVNQTTMPVVAWRLNAAVGLGIEDDHMGKSQVIQKYLGFYNQMVHGVPTSRMLFREWTETATQNVLGQNITTPDAMTWLQLMWTPDFSVLKTNHDLWKQWWPEDV